MSDTKPSQQVRRFKPFTIVFDNGTNGTMILPPPATGQRMRMEWKRANHFNRTNRHGRPAAKNLGRLESMPDIPGMQLHVRPHPDKPGCVSCEITDPLKDKPDLLEHVSSVLADAAVIGSDAKRKAAPGASFDFDRDEGKTFLIALRQLVDQKTAHVVSGECPTQDEIAELPGDEIYDPLSPLNGKRRYVRDVVGV